MLCCLLYKLGKMCMWQKSDIAVVLSECMRHLAEHLRFMRCSCHVKLAAQVVFVIASWRHTATSQNVHC